MGSTISSPPGDKFIDRGDPAAIDIDQTTISVTGSWTDLDLSGVIPLGTTAVALKVTLNDGTIARYLQFRTKGNANSINTSKVIIQVANNSITDDLIVATNGLQLIQYYLLAALTSISVTIKGWWK